MFWEKLTKRIGSMKKSILAANDIRQIKASGVSTASVEEQLAAYRRGSSYLKLNRPCAVKDGIVSIAPEQRKRLIDLYENNSGKYRLMKFVPASGAASRMFTDWFSASEKGSLGTEELVRKFFRDLNKFPFFPFIAENKTGAKLLGKKEISE